MKKRHQTELDQPRVNFAFRHQILSYAGVIGGALTLLGSFESIIRLTHFVGVIVSNWTKWTNDFWYIIFNAFSLPIHEDVYVDLTLATMFLSAGLGGQIWWRKRFGSTEPWFNYGYVKGWHIPAGALILILSLSIPPQLFSPISLWINDYSLGFKFLAFHAFSWV
ncbi:MAG: hypothetical protein WA957_11765, partial [Alteraurantiacibacter sp.]